MPSNDRDSEDSVNDWRNAGNVCISALVILDLPILQVRVDHHLLSWESGQPNGKQASILFLDLAPGPDPVSIGHCSDKPGIFGYNAMVAASSL